MSEKVKLTREQAEAIKSIRGDINGGFTPGNIRTQLKKQWMSKPYATLNELPFEQFIVAVLGDYEVEPIFEVGDWAVDRRSVYKIISKHHADYLNKEVHPEVRHATPEEITEEKQCRWWAKHGRDVWELKDLDILINEKTGKMYEVDILKDETIRLWKIGVDGAFASDYKSAKEISKYVEVFCFAEDRKDVGHAE